MEKYNLNIDVYDPWADPEQVKREFDLSLLSEKEQLRTAYDAVVLTVAHTAFTDFPIENHTADKAVVFDVKAFLNKDKIDGRL